MSTQTTTCKVTGQTRGVTHELEIHTRNHKPHWLRWGEGWANMRITIGEYASGFSLYFDTTESYTTDKGRDCSKRTMLTMEEDAARQLYAILHERFKA